jgi:hypothetical protein
MVEKDLLYARPALALLGDVSRRSSETAKRWALIAPNFFPLAEASRSMAAF